MNRRTHRSLVALLAIVGMLTFVFASWTKHLSPDAASELHKASKHPYSYSAGPASSTVYLAKIKQRVAAIAAASITAAVQSLHSNQSPIASEMRTPTWESDPSRPLWLVNRALLI